jgi:predicted RecB family nuclease
MGVVWVAKLAQTTAESLQHYHGGLVKKTNPTTAQAAMQARTITVAATMATIATLFPDSPVELLVDSACGLPISSLIFCLLHEV